MEFVAIMAARPLPRIEGRPGAAAFVHLGDIQATPPRTSDSRPDCDYAVPLR